MMKQCFRENFFPVVDSSAKFITSGLLEGNFADYGRFDECLAIADDEKEIYGKYCLTTVDLKSFLSEFSPSKSKVTILLLNETQNVRTPFI